MAKKFLLGPGEGGRIQARFTRTRSRGAAANLATQAMKVLEDDGEARLRAQRLARARQGDSARHCASRRPVATASRASRWPKRWKRSFEGRVVGFYREPGVCRPGGRLSAGVATAADRRSSAAGERDDVAVINSLQIWSPVAGRMIP